MSPTMATTRHRPMTTNTVVTRLLLLTSIAVGSTGTTGQHRHEQKFRKGIGGEKHLAGPVMFHQQGLGPVAGERDVDAILAWGKAVGRREAVMAGHGSRLEIRRDREGNGGR